MRRNAKRSPQSSAGRRAARPPSSAKTCIAYKPIEFDLDGLKRSTTIPDVLSFEIEGVASRNRSGEPFYIDNTAHPAGRRLALARAKEMHMHGFGLDLDLA
jgi:hypothetical protein